MKTFVVIAAFMAAAICGASAQTADIRVSYTACSPGFRKDGDTVTNQYILLAGGAGSKFYSPRTEAIDSLTSTPDGDKAYREMCTSAVLGANLKGLPKRDGSYYVTKDMDKGALTHYDKVGVDYLLYSEPVETLDWSIGDSVKTVLGYECLPAVVNYHGRRWTAWFAPDIAVSNGPWKLHGLPGLILAATADGGYSFTATGLEQVATPITPIYQADKYQATDRKKYLKAKRDFTDNPLGKLNAQFGGAIIKVEDANGKPITKVNKANADFIETDYRK